MNTANFFEPGFVKSLASLYGESPGTLEKQEKRYEGLVRQFQGHFGKGEIHFFSTPGRIEIGGNHTDHNRGKVLAAAIDLDAVAAAARRESRDVTLHSEGYSHVFEVDLASLEARKDEQGTTQGLIRGIAARFEQMGFETGGFSACMTSDVLPGSGLSSSAALEVLVGTIFNHLYNGGKIPPATLARIGQFAENEYFGKPCGLMDQLACALGGIVAIDFFDPGNPVARRVDFDFAGRGFNLLVVDTGGSHSDLTPDYAAIPWEMKMVAEFFGQQVCRDIKEKDILANLAALRDRVGDRPVLRALHFLAENRRVDEQVAALGEGEFQRFLALVQDSGDSSARWLQNCFSPQTPGHQGINLALVLSEGYIDKTGRGACRVHGGGFAAAILVFLPGDDLGEYIELMEKAFGAGRVLVLNARDRGTHHLGSIK